MHISSADKKEKPWFLKALKTRRNPFFDKTVRKTGFIQFGAGGRTRTGTPSLAVDFESTTSTNSITPALPGYYTIPHGKIQARFAKISLPGPAYAR